MFEERKKSAFGTGSAFGGYSMGAKVQEKPKSAFGNFSMGSVSGQGND